MITIVRIIRTTCIFCFTLTTIGCVKYVDVPVWVCPAPIIPVQEKLKTDSVADNSTDGDILKAMVWDLVYLKGRTQSLELLLEGYKRPPEDLSKLLPKK
jgi:hypothetical protein